MSKGNRYVLGQTEDRVRKEMLMEPQSRKETVKNDRWIKYGNNKIK